MGGRKAKTSGLRVILSKFNHETQGRLCRAIDLIKAIGGSEKTNKFDTSGGESPVWEGPFRLENLQTKFN